MAEALQESKRLLHLRSGVLRLQEKLLESPDVIHPEDTLIVYPSLSPLLCREREYMLELAAQ